MRLFLGFGTEELVVVGSWIAIFYCIRLILFLIADLGEEELVVAWKVIFFHGTIIELSVSIFEAINWNSNISQYGCFSITKSIPIAWIVEFFFAFVKAFLNLPSGKWVKFTKNGVNCSFDKYVYLNL